MTSNTSGILISRPHGGYRLAKQTEWGDEYVAFAYTAAEAWKKTIQDYRKNRTRT